MKLRAAFAAMVMVVPAWGIVISTGDPNSSIYTVGYQEVVGGVNLSGVVRVTSSRGGCTGALLGDGYSILTAAHCVTTAYGATIATGITASFQGPSGFVPMSVDLTFISPAYTGNATLGGDLAVLRMTGQAPVYASRYSLYGGGMPNDPILMAGYGLSGVGASGYSGTYGYGTLRAGLNQYFENGAAGGWSPMLLLGQFYNASQPSTNVLGVANPYTASDQVMIAPGDSGGPSFYNGAIIGVHNVIACASDNGSTCLTPPSVTTALRSSFGQYFADLSVADNAGWIESQMVPEPATFLMLAPALLFLSRRIRAKIAARIL